MKFKHKALIIEVEPFKPGMEDGILCIVRDRKNTRTEEVYFAHKKNEDTQRRIKASRYSACVVDQSPAIMVDGLPKAIREGDYVQSVPCHDVVTAEHIEEYYDATRGRNRGQQNTETTAAGGSDKTEDSSEQEGGQVRQGGEPETEPDNPEPADGK